MPESITHVQFFEDAEMSAVKRWAIALRGSAMMSLVLWVLGALLCGEAWSSAEGQTLQQLNHKSWTLANGAPGVIYSIAQTSDGTLWLGGASGLTRFDGLKFVRYDGPPGQPFEQTYIRSIAASPDGGLWIGFNLGGIGYLKNGSYVQYGKHDGLPVTTVINILTDPSGATYAATLQGLYQLQGKRWERVIFDSNNPNARVEAATLDFSGTLWVLTGTGVLARLAGTTQFTQIAKRNNLQPMSSRSLAAGPDGTMWVRNLNRLGGMTRLDARADSMTSPNREFAFQDTSLSAGILVDKQGNLWMGGNAVRRLPAASVSGGAKDTSQRIESFTVADGLTGWTVTCFFEDREGNVWVGTYAGLDRFSPSNVVRLIYPDPAGGVAAVAGDAGTMFASSRSMSSDGTFPVFEVHGNSIAKTHAAPQFTSAYRSPEGSVWFGGPNGVMRFEAGGLVSAIALPERDDVQAIVQDSAGAMWISIVRKGVFRVKDGQWSANGNLSALPHSPVLVETRDPSGKLWFGYTESRLARIDGTTVHLYAETDGLKVGNVTAIAARMQHLWIGGEQGLARFDGTRFHPIRAASYDFLTGISGIVEADDGDLWLNGNRGVVHIPREEIEKAEHDAAYTVKADLFNYLDGLPGYAKQQRPTPSAIEGTDGRLWFVTEYGLASIDPRQIKRNLLPPPVTIWSLRDGDVQYPASLKADLPIHTNNVRIEYTAGSLTIPERVRFRHKLDGLDNDWQDAGDRREASYTNLGPGQYTFHVIASNNDGVWNDTGSSLAFEIAPAFYQTNWFRGFCVLLGLALLRVLYMFRIRQLSAQARGRLEEVLGERERIARELHDTLLQSVQGLVLLLHNSIARMPRQDPVRSSIEHALDRADDVLLEGRDRVQSLRSSQSADFDLPPALAALGEELAVGQSANFRLTVVGIPRDLHPIVCEEVLFIVREALTNAHRHAHARNIEVEVSFADAELTINVTDDGRGIANDVLKQGERAGHWGLPGMRERAKKIGAQIEISGRHGGGTTIKLKIPGTLAYRGRGMHFNWFSLRRIIAASRGLVALRGQTDRDSRRR